MDTAVDVVEPMVVVLVDEVVLAAVVLVLATEEGPLAVVELGSVGAAPSPPHARAVSTRAIGTTVRLILLCDLSPAIPLVYVSNVVGLALFVLLLAPGWVWVRVAEKRQVRPERSPLLEAVVLVITGVVFTSIAVAVIATVGVSPLDWLFRGTALIPGLGVLYPKQAQRADRKNFPCALRLDHLVGNARTRTLLAR